MATITILGAGVMGSALTIPLTDRGHAVRLIGTHLDTDIIKEIHQTRTHPRLKAHIPEVVIPYPIAGLGEALPGADLLLEIGPALDPMLEQGELDGSRLQF